MKENKHLLVFEEWKARLRSKNRDKDHVADNFLELFENIKLSGSSFEEAHSLLSAAIKAHLPDATVSRRVYEQYKRVVPNAKKEKEFIQSWIDNISNIATESFYDVFEQSLPHKREEPVKKYTGNISEGEYKSLRKYADQFEIIDTKELETQLRFGGYMPLDDDDFKGTVLGENNGDNK